MEKREKIQRSYDHYKRQVQYWEIAMMKNTNRRPSPNDLSKAPVSIQKAYKEYRKIKKYLESRSMTEDEDKQLNETNSKLKLTPQNIFFRHKSETSISAGARNRSPVAKKAGLYKKLSSKLFTISSSSGVDWDANATIFKKTTNELSNSSKEEVSCEVNETQAGSSTPQKMETSVETSNIQMECQSEDDFVDDTCVTKENELPNKNVNRISALWHNSLSATNDRCNPSADDGRRVDKGWLERCTNYNEKIFKGVDTTLSARKQISPVAFSPSPEKLQLKRNILLKKSSTEQDAPVSSITTNECNNHQSEEEFNCGVSETEPCSLTSQEFEKSTEANNAVVECQSKEDYGIVKESCIGGAPNKNTHNVVFNEVDMRLSARKRSSTVAFSPSPEKLQPKRKFFKRSRAERDKERVVPKSTPTTPSIKTRSSVKSSEELTSSTKILNEVCDDLSTKLNPESPVEVSPLINSKKESSLKLCEVVGHTEPRTTKSTVELDIYDELVQAGSSKKIKAARLTGRQLLERKIKNGNLNQNFVRIDVGKKVFVRGHKKISGVKVKRNDWKKKKSAAFKGSKSSTLTCRKCGETGHFAKFCITGMTTAKTEEPEVIDDSPFPSLEEAARMAFSKKASNIVKNSTMPESQQELCSQQQEVATEKHSESSLDINMDVGEHEIQPLEENNSSPYFAEYDTDINEQDKIIQQALNLFGYTSFRAGQKEAILRVLKGLSTLVILSTGSGKSLCYQLPAYLYSKRNPGDLTLCISPLVSLMEDQVQGVPSFLQAACLHNNMSTKQKEIVLEKLRNKTLQILLVSPEAICGGLFGLMKTGNLPPISFACIDEVHCVSQWSHNFRPSYLQLCKILTQKLHVKTILGLTATATDQTSASICEHIQIDPSTTVKGEIIPTNLNLSASRDRDREEALLNLLRGDRFKDCDSIIIYCTRRDDCETLAKFIRINLQEGSFNGLVKGKARQKISCNCEAYHAGMTPTRRRNVQKLFMNGDIRIVVATVAFGMGIDKSDIRAVIHYNMPKTFESYVQEIGRAGRDGLPAQCHLFLDNVKGKDLCELKRHVYSNSIDRTTIRKLLRKMYKPCKCSRIAEITNESHTEKKGSPKRCTGHEVSFSVNDTITELDLPQENIMTILCYMELDSQRKWIEVLPLTYEMCKVHSYGGSKLLKTAARKCPPLAVAIALQKEKKKFKDNDSYIEFNVIEAAATVGWSSAIVKRELKNLEWSGTEFDEKGNPTKFRKSGMLVEFSELAFRIEVPGDLTEVESDELLDYLHKMNLDQEKTQLHQLHRVYQALFSISAANVGDSCDGFNVDKSDRLKQFIHDYFRNSKMELSSSAVDSTPGTDKEDEIRRDARNLIFSSSDTKFTGRAIAKIFQGIPSPCFPAEQWGRNRSFWRRHLDVDFHLLCQLAGQEVLQNQ